MVEIHFILHVANSICITNIKILRIKFIADYDKMTIHHYLQQPRSILESQLIKHIKNKHKINKRSFAFILKRYEMLYKLSYFYTSMYTKNNYIYMSTIQILVFL